MTTVDDLSAELRAPLFEYLLRLGDDRLVLGHRLSEWCGHGPILEEDIALANVALDLIGQANNLLRLAGEVEGAGRSGDDLAYFREAVEFRNVQLVEQVNGDYGQTIARSFLFDVFAVLQAEALLRSSFAPLAGIAAKCHKESLYHLRRSGEWLLRLGDGTAESNERVQGGLDAMWSFTRELFQADDVDVQLFHAGIGVDLHALAPRWRRLVEEQIHAATLALPEEDRYYARGGRQGRHTEYLGHMLAEMQIVARSHPGAQW